LFDIGGWEFLLIGILGVIIIGPKELPGAVRTVSIFIRRTRGLARDFQSGLEDVAREAEIDNIKDDLTDIMDPTFAAGEFRRQVENVVDPDGRLQEAMDVDSDWYGDDRIDYDAPEYADNNQMLAPRTDSHGVVKDGTGAAINIDEVEMEDDANASVDGKKTDGAL
jgi:sec-independent protein translocase protein TatB